MLKLFLILCVLVYGSLILDVVLFGRFCLINWMFFSGVLNVIFVCLIIWVVFVNCLRVMLFCIKLEGVVIGDFSENGVFYCGVWLNWNVNFLNMCVLVFVRFMVLF